MQKGKIGVTTDNIFPIIKKFLYSDHEIFLRELISNAVDATQKLKTMSSVGDFKGELGDPTVQVKLDKEAKTLTVSDHGIGMTSEEIEQYINQIAFSSAEDFLEKYKDKVDAIIGHFGLGFYSAFMVAEKVEIITKSHKEGSQAIRWICDGSPEYSLEDVDKASFGTDIVLHIDEESKEFLEESRVEGLLTKYCKFLPVAIGFGKEKEWKEDKYIDTDKNKVINNTKPAWTRKPADLKDEDYKSFYKELYPASFEDPLFNIHLNVDYPFNLTGILYFPRIASNLEIQKNKIQLYCNQVYVTDSVEGIVPEFLTLLHGVIDSPDIPLNVSRSYLQSDSNVKKIASHINKKVADRLNDIFKTDRSEFEKKWDDLKLFVTYGMISEEKFYERALKFALLKNSDGKCFTHEEYANLVKTNQTDKNNKVIYIYATDRDEQYTFIEAAKSKGYDVLMLDGQLDSHLINHLESKLTDTKFIRVDGEVVDKLVEKDDIAEVNLSQDQKDELSPVFQSHLAGKKDNFMVAFEGLSVSDNPIIITQSEFMRRMKDMSAMGGGGMGGMYGALPDTFNLVVNANHPLVNQIVEDLEKSVGDKVKEAKAQITPIDQEIKAAEEAQKDKKEEEILQADKDKLEELRTKHKEFVDKKAQILTDYGKENKLVKQMVDLALLANGMLKGEELTKFVKRSVELIEK